MGEGVQEVNTTSFKTAVVCPRAMDRLVVTWLTLVYMTYLVDGGTTTEFMPTTETNALEGLSRLRRDVV